MCAGDPVCTVGLTAIVWGQTGPPRPLVQTHHDKKIFPSCQRHCQKIFLASLVSPLTISCLLLNPPQIPLMQYIQIPYKIWTLTLAFEVIINDLLGVWPTQRKGFQKSRIC